jgi:hypothetical protein
MLKKGIMLTTLIRIKYQEAKFLIKIALFFIILPSCNYKKVGGNNDVGVIQYDTIRSFYKNGKIKYVKPLKDGFSNGKYVEFYPNGNLLVEKEFKEGVLSGYTKYYYEDGVLKGKLYYVDNKPFGHAYFYFENGNIDTYSSFDFLGNARYVRKYDLNGDIIKDEGSALGQMYGYLDDSLNIFFSFAMPPNTYNEINGLKYEDGNISNLNINMYRNSGGVVLEKEFSGLLLIIGELRDSVNNVLVVKDSLFFPDAETFRERKW